MPNTPRALPNLLRQLNRAAVVSLVRRERTITPSSIARRLDLSISTVMRVLDDLTDEGLVISDGHSESERGRPPARIKFCGDMHAIIGIEATASSYYGAVADLNGTIVAESEVVVEGEDGVRNVELLIAFIKKLMALPRPAGQTIRGIGIGVPSMVRYPSGEVVLTLGLGWRDMPLQRLVGQHFGLPVFVENDRNLAALGELGFGAGTEAQNLVNFYLGMGTGAGIVIDGKLHRGHAHSAGEIVWFLNLPSLSGRPYPHLTRERPLWPWSLPQEAFPALARADDLYRTGRLALDVAPSSADPGLGLADDLLDYVTTAVASLTSIIDPDVVILAGKITGGGDLLLDTLRSRMSRYLYHMPKLVYTQLTHRDVVMGAIMNVLYETTLNPPALSLHHP